MIFRESKLRSKPILFFLFLILSQVAYAQQNVISLGYGLNYGDAKIFREREHIVTTNNFAVKLSYSRLLTKFIIGKVEIAYSDYDVINQSLNKLTPEFTERPYSRTSVSVGPQFKLLSAKNFTFLSGFNAGYHWGSDETVSSSFYSASYFDFAINPLSISYQIKGFTIEFDTYIGSNMYSNLFFGMGYTF